MLSCLYKIKFNMIKPRYSYIIFFLKDIKLHNCSRAKVSVCVGCASHQSQWLRWMLGTILSPPSWELVQPAEELPEVLQWVNGSSGAQRETVVSVVYKLHIYIYLKKRHKNCSFFCPEKRSELICKKLKKEQTHLTQLQGVPEHLTPYVSKVLRFLRRINPTGHLQ